MTEFFSMIEEPVTGRRRFRIAESTTDCGVPNKWSFQQCINWTGPSPVLLALSQDGIACDYSETAYGTPIVSVQLADLWRTIAKDDVQLIPAELPNASERCFIANILSNIDCIDYEHSRGSFFPANDPVRSGKPSGFLELAINPKQVRGQKLFRLTDWLVGMIVSDNVRSRMKAEGITGVHFLPIATHGHS